LTFAEYFTKKLYFIDNWNNFGLIQGNRSRGVHHAHKRQSLAKQKFGFYAHQKSVPKMSKRQLADQYSTFNYSQSSGGNQI